MVNINFELEVVKDDVRVKSKEKKNVYNVNYNDDLDEDIVNAVCVLAKSKEILKRIKEGLILN